MESQLSYRSTIPIGEPELARWVPFSVVGAGTVVAFAADLLMPLGVAGGTFQVAPILLAAWLTRGHLVRYTAALATLLVIVAAFASPGSETLWVVVANRTVSIVAIWLVALYAILWKRTVWRLREIIQGLDALVVKRTAELALANADLAHRNRELELANNDLESFAYSVSHDLRAPLRAVNGFGRMLADTCPDLDDEAQRKLSLILRNGQRMAEIIDGLLTFSRTARRALHTQPSSIAAVAREAAEEQMALAQSDRRPDIRVPDDLPYCDADSLLLKQVFANLIGNAIKFSRGQASPVIEVDCVEDQPTGMVTVSVRDNGIGFPQEQADRIFGAFERLHTDAEFEGTGIGLALVQRIVSRHGGQIWAIGEPGKGASFHFTMPMASTVAAGRAGAPQGDGA